MTKMQAALHYAKKGWKVFPCAPNSKAPLFGGQHGCKDATDDIEKISQWWTQCPDANIGLACGSASGVWVVDVDVRNETGINGFDSIKNAGKRIVETVSQNTPSGGKHFLYKCDGEKPANKNGFLPGVDIRGDGYYVIVAPSSINGKKYEWVESMCQIAEFPDEFKPIKNVFNQVMTTPVYHRVKGDSSTDRALSYLAEIPGAVEHVDGHAKLFWVAQVLVNGFRLSDSEVEDMMWNEYNPRCVPPWDRNPKTEREFRHKISEAHAKPNQEAMAIFDAYEACDINDFDFDACIADVRGLIYPSAVIGIQEKKDISKQEAIMNDMFVPQGLVGDIARWINETAFCLQPDLAVGAALTLCGAIMGRKVRDESNGRTNIYCMGIAPSSAGKDHPGDCINQILTASGAQHLMMGRMTSDTAIEKALAVTPHVKISVMDEVGHFFSNINKAGDNASYLKTIKPTLMELFSSAHKTYIGKEKASGSAPIISQPCMCIWGVTVPDKLYSGMTVEELQDGWIARNLLFIAPDEIPDIVIKPSATVPESISNTVRAWCLRMVSQSSVITADPGGGNEPIVVPMDIRAKARFDKFNIDARSALRSAHKAGDKTQYLWGKALQNARRIALIVACGREFENPEITFYDADYGCRLVEYLVRKTIKAIDANVVESQWEKDKIRILKIIDTAWKDGITRNELTRKTQWVKDRRARQTYIDDLIEAGSVVQVGGAADETNPKAPVVYFSKRAYERHELETGVEHVDAE